MANTFHLTIYTPDEKITDSQVVSVTATASDGILCILANHMALVTRLEVSILEIVFPEDKIERYVINGGMLSVRKNQVLINTIEAQLITGKNPDLELFPKAILAKNQNVQEQITEALKLGGYFNPDKIAASLMAEERLAKFEILRSLLKGA